jgi:hypothetical protein
MSWAEAMLDAVRELEAAAREDEYRFRHDHLLQARGMLRTLRVAEARLSKLVVGKQLAAATPMPEWNS